MLYEQKQLKGSDSSAVHRANLEPNLHPLLMSGLPSALLQPFPLRAIVMFALAYPLIAHMRPATCIQISVGLKPSMGAYL